MPYQIELLGHGLGGAMMEARLALTGQGQSVFVPVRGTGSSLRAELWLRPADGGLVQLVSSDAGNGTNIGVAGDGPRTRGDSVHGRGRAETDAQAMVDKRPKQDHPGVGAFRHASGDGILPDAVRA